MSWLRRQRNWDTPTPPSDQERDEIHRQLQARTVTAETRVREQDRVIREYERQFHSLNETIGRYASAVEEEIDKREQGEDRLEQLLTASAALVVELQDAWWMRAAAAANDIMSIATTEARERIAAAREGEAERD